MARTTTSTRERILQAATTQFARYGYKRTSMEDIAQEAGLSRTALYLQFRNKEGIFRELARELHEAAIARAGEALSTAGPFGERLVRAVEAKTLQMLEIARSSSHGGELTDEKNRLCGDLAADGDRAFVAALAHAFREADAAGEIDLAGAGVTAKETAGVFANAAAGLKGDASASVDTYRKRLATMTRVFVTGLGGSASAKRESNSTNQR